MPDLKNPGFNAQTALAALGIGLLVAVAVGYAIYQARFFLAGPDIAFTTPENGLMAEEQVIAVEGTAERISFLELNDRQIYINEAGVFEEKLLLSPGVNIIKLEAHDRFGRDVTRFLHVTYEGYSNTLSQSPSFD